MRLITWVKVNTAAVGLLDAGMRAENRGGGSYARIDRHPSVYNGRRSINASAFDPAQEVARVATEKRAVLLRAYRGRLRTEDLEDCFSQATLELLLRARRGGGFDSETHIANALEQKFCSRIGDRHRALGGRSAMEAALAGALPLGDPEGGGVEVADPCTSTERAVEDLLHLRHVLAVAGALTYDQRLVLASQVQLDLSPREFCEHFGWSPDKYRKVAQRGRARLRALIAGADQVAGGVGVGERAGVSLQQASRRANHVGDGQQDPPMNPTPLIHRCVPGGAVDRPKTGSRAAAPRAWQRRSQPTSHGDAGTPAGDWGRGASTRTPSVAPAVAAQASDAG